MGASASTIAQQTAGQLYSSLADSGAFPLLLEVHSSSNGSSHECSAKHVVQLAEERKDSHGVLITKPGHQRRGMHDRVIAALQAYSTMATPLIKGPDLKILCGQENPACEEIGSLVQRNLEAFERLCQTFIVGAQTAQIDSAIVTSWPAQYGVVQADAALREDDPETKGPKARDLLVQKLKRTVQSWIKDPFAWDAGCGGGRMLERCDGVPEYGLRNCFTHKKEGAIEGYMIELISVLVELRVAPSGVRAGPLEEQISCIPGEKRLFSHEWWYIIGGIPEEERHSLQQSGDAFRYQRQIHAVLNGMSELQRRGYAYVDECLSVLGKAEPRVDGIQHGLVRWIADASLKGVEVTSPGMLRSLMVNSRGHGWLIAQKFDEAGRKVAYLLPKVRGTVDMVQHSSIAKTDPLIFAGTFSDAHRLDVSSGHYSSFARTRARSASSLSERLSSEPSLTSLTTTLRAFLESIGSVQEWQQQYPDCTLVPGHEEGWVRAKEYGETKKGAENTAKTVAEYMESFLHEA